MLNPLPISDDLWNQVPPEVQALILAMQQRIADLEAENREFRARIEHLESRLKLNSTNSSKPPSSDPIGFKRRPPAPASKRKRGGQPGHRKSVRPLVPPEQVDETIDCVPEACRRCGEELEGVDPDPRIHQVAELPKITPIVTEYRIHQLECTRCRTTTAGSLPDGVSGGCFGVYLQAVLATLAGAYRLSKRQIQQIAHDLFGLTVSIGMIAKLERQTASVLEAPYTELAASVQQADVVNLDETSWRENRDKAWLWTAVTRVATVLFIAGRRTREVAESILGNTAGRIVGSDRYSVYDSIPAARRQVCWAHLRRDFQKMIDRGGLGKIIGERLLKLSNGVFRNWHRARDGTMTRLAFERRMRGYQRGIRNALNDGRGCGCAKTAATCRGILGIEAGLWTFARVEGVEPTNNAAERSLRHAVIWRKISGGTDSEAGSRFVERMLSVVATCRQQKRDVLEYLSSCIRAHRHGQLSPSLLPATTERIKVA